MRNLKFSIADSGHTFPVPLTKRRGYTGDKPVIEIEGIPDDVPDSAVMATYNRCMIFPLMHAEAAIPWVAIEGARQGQIVRLNPGGRPAKSNTEKFVRANVTLAPDVLALVDAQAEAQGVSRSALIAGLIMDRWG